MSDGFDWLKVIEPEFELVVPAFTVMMPHELIVLVQTVMVADPLDESAYMLTTDPLRVAWITLGFELLVTT